MGSSPLDHRESDMTRLSNFTFFIHFALQMSLTYCRGKN